MNNICIRTLILSFAICAAHAAFGTAIDVYIIAGQSNAGSQGTLTDISAPTQPYAHIFRGSEDGNQSTIFTIPSNWKGWSGIAPSTNFGPEGSFAAALPQRCVILRYSHGGSFIDDWLSSPNSYASDMVSFVNSSLASISTTYGVTPTIKGVIWIQGESDATGSTTAANYYTNLKSLISYVDGQFGNSNLPWVVSALNSKQQSFGAYWSTVNGAQNRLPAENQHAVTVETEDLTVETTYHVHYVSASVVTLGTRLANAALHIPSTGVAGGPLSNLSVRAWCDTTGDDLLIGSCVTDVNGDLPILVRGVGDTLAASFGVTGTMYAPIISGTMPQQPGNPPLALITDRPAVVDNFGTTALGAFGLTGQDVEGIVNVQANQAYTFVVTPTTAGNGMLEFYHGGSSAFGGKLINLSARARAGGTPYGSMILGFVITGSSNINILIRAIGPTLTGFGISNAHADPAVTLRTSSGTFIASNDDWPSSLASTFTTVGAFGLSTGSKDAALLATLAPGVYTATITNGSSVSSSANGVVLGEIYVVP